jgi:hypothetical protein
MRRSGVHVVTIRFKEVGETEGHLFLFIDLKKAYDSVWREGLFKKREQEGVPTKLVRLVRVWYQGVSAKVKKM